MLTNTLDVGDEIPDFSLDSQLGPISYRDMIDGKWSILVTFSTAFEPVATTEIGMISKLIDQFEARGILIAAIGNDTVSNYNRWIKDIEEIQTVKVKIPILCDRNCAVLKAFGCAKEDIINKKIVPTSHGVFIIDIDKRIRSSMRYSTLVGRNWYEVLRQFDALIMVTFHRVICPANWGQGQEVMLQKEATPEEAALYRSIEIKPWFRLTPCPDN